MKRVWLMKGVIGGIGLVAIVVTVIIFAPQPLVSTSIKRAVTSTILVPTSSDVTVARDSVKYDSRLKLFIYTATTGGVKFVVSQQPTPQSFTDIPQVYDKVVASMNEYGSFDSSIGTVYLTRPKDLAGKQAAVMNAKGTLMFVKPARDLGDDQWRQLFNSLEIVK